MRPSCYDKLPYNHNDSRNDSRNRNRNHALTRSLEVNVDFSHRATAKRELIVDFLMI